MPLPRMSVTGLKRGYVPTRRWLVPDAKEAAILTTPVGHPQPSPPRARVSEGDGFDENRVERLVAFWTLADGAHGTSWWPVYPRALKFFFNAP